MTHLLRFLVLSAVVLSFCKAIALKGPPSAVWNPSDHVKLDLSVDKLIVSAKASASQAMTLHKGVDFSVIPSAYELKGMNAKIAASVADGSNPHQLQQQQGKRKLATPTSFTCESFATFSPFQMCSDIVDYPFLVETSSTLAAMETAVRAMLPTSTLGFINNYCLSDLKKLVCARVYQPCVSGGKCAALCAGARWPRVTHSSQPTLTLPLPRPCNYRQCFSCFRRLKH